jgi:F0F1-type ATP synthase membrane subunit b/b'
MDNQFNTLSRSYHDNYIQYKTTGKDSYKNAYESAEKGLQSIIDSLKKQVDGNRKEIKDALGSNAKSLWSEKQQQMTNIGMGIQEQKDRVTAAKMRQPPPPPPFSHQTQYIVLGSMLAAIVLLQVF